MFNRRTTPPTADDKNYIGVGFGGMNHALVINRATGYVLPNCCGYAHGRALENSTPGTEAALCRNNACAYYAYTADGLERSKTEPRAGAIMCWKSSGANNYGHVAIVEEVYSNGDVLASASNYSGTLWYTSRFTRASGYKLSSSKSVYSFEGFIYMPDEIKRVGDPVPRDKSKHQIEVVYSALRARKRPELGAEVVGYANRGYYDVLAVKDMTSEPSNGYVWFKIGAALWVAYVEGCVNDLPEEEPIPDELERLRAENAELRRDVLSLELTAEKLRDTIDRIAELAHYN